MTASGRKLPLNFAGFATSERPVLVRAVIRPGWMAALHPKAAIGLELVSMTAADPLQTSNNATSGSVDSLFDCCAFATVGTNLLRAA